MLYKGALKMELKRKIYEKILSWKNTSRGQTALLIEGARRIGKSTIAEKFAKENYKSYVIIDFGKFFCNSGFSNSSCSFY